MGTKLAYKLAQPDGWDFCENINFNYRENIGKEICVTDTFSVTLSAYKNPNDAFLEAEIPCSVFLVEGDPVEVDEKKYRFKSLKIIEELKPEKVFRWRYTEAVNPVNPSKITPPEITEEHIKLLQEWASVKNTAKNSIEAVVKVSAYKSVGEAVFDEVSDSIWFPLKELVWETLRVGIDEALVDFFWAYVGYIFAPCIEKWEYIEKEKYEKGYPFQSAVDLWKMGLIASYTSYNGKWRLHGGENMEVLWEGKIKIDLKKGE